MCCLLKVKVLCHVYKAFCFIGRVQIHSVTFVQDDDTVGGN